MGRRHSDIYKMKTKKKFTVNAEQKSMTTWTYTVEAQSRKEAIDMVINDEVIKNDDEETFNLGDTKYIAFVDDETDPQ